VINNDKIPYITIVGNTMNQAVNQPIESIILLVNFAVLICELGVFISINIYVYILEK
jgi:hypothetical protein